MRRAKQRGERNDRAPWKAEHQTSAQRECAELLPRGWGEAPAATQSGEAGRASLEPERSGATDRPPGTWDNAGCGEVLPHATYW